MTTNHWLIAAVICVGAEIIPPSTHFFCLCLTFGAVGGAIASVYGLSTWLQWVVFAVTSVMLIPLLIPLAKFLFASSRHSTNANAQK